MVLPVWLVQGFGLGVGVFLGVKVLDIHIYKLV